MSLFRDCRHKIFVHWGFACLTIFFLGPHVTAHDAIKQTRGPNFLPLGYTTHLNLAHAQGLYKSPPLFSFEPTPPSYNLRSFPNSLKTLVIRIAMALPRTPDLPAWDPVLPAMDALRCFGLAETEEVPLRVDPAGHIRGGVTGKVSAIPSRFLYFFLQINIGQC